MLRLVALALAFLPSAVWAGHARDAIYGSMEAGFAHPILGADHVLAMVTMGLLAAAEDGRARLVLPGAFLGAMAAGLSLSAFGIALPFLDRVILASVLVLGALVALSLRPGLALGASLAAVFGLFHGADQGLGVLPAELLPFALGVVIAAALLQSGGLALASLLMGGLGPAMATLPMRMLGAGLGLGGIALAFAP